VSRAAELHSSRTQWSPLCSEAAVSVVICAFNEAEHIGRLLDSLTNQTLQPAEVIVVDDGSTDKTGGLATLKGVRTVRVPHRGPARGRNIGAHAATGDILVFLDGDMACTPRFIERLGQPIIAGAIGSFTREIYIGNLSNPWSRAYAKIRGLEHGRLLPATFPGCWDNFRASRRDAFLGVGGNDDVGYGSDRTVARKLRERAVVAPGAECFHFNPSSLYEIFSNGRWIGRGPQIRDIRPPWRDHLPHRVIRWTRRDIRAGLPGTVATAARTAYHLGVVVGLLDSVLRPGRHWK
jgi:glycosyltransferase involved in cell wall biosynthesis